MGIVVHTMTYTGDIISPPILQITNYCDCDYEDYKNVYNECFLKCELH